MWHAMDNESPSSRVRKAEGGWSNFLVTLLPVRQLGLVAREGDVSNCRVLRDTIIISHRQEENGKEGGNHGQTWFRTLTSEFKG
jgi:hypothetical protein